MIAMSFILFALLIVGWFIAPSSDIKEDVVKATAPTMKLGEAGV